MGSIKRLDDWWERLNAYIKANLGRKLDYCNYDCCRLVSEAVEALTGFNPYPMYPYSYETKEEALKTIYEYCTQRGLKPSVANVIKTILIEKGAIETSSPSRGDIITTPQGAGVCLGETAALLVEGKGLDIVKIKTIKIELILRFK